ncbi:unnamed protein product [Brachionus calyciflorus]|uniref:Reverse transcriptase domain-containing protein n=1 Tax=Brachionus calyciflorus TaxID=104777 RepID=A0A814H489_9BILA|nr:unnamed protein product [Brachionus calyciflorus]
MISISSSYILGNEFRKLVIPGTIVFRLDINDKKLKFPNYSLTNLIKLINLIDDNSKPPNNLEYWKGQFPSVFTGKIGRWKNLELKLHIDESVKPVQAKQRNKPFHLRKVIDEEIKSKLEQDLIEEVVGEPTEWLSETVVVPKPNNKVRLCIDLKAANKAIKRERYQMPNVEDIIYKANEMYVFTVLDLISSYEQMVLHPDSRKISRFRTHKGIFQYKRLFFGINSAPEIFHQELEKLIENIKGAQNAIDDILIMGKTFVDNFETVRQVLQRLAETGLTLNEKKCQFGLTEVTFFGVKLSASGISLSDQKVEALKQLKTPENASELHSFLGLSTFASRWIPGLSQKTDSLWKKIHQKTNWVWTKQDQEQLEAVKQGVIESVGYFRLDWKTSLYTDASVKGLSAVLVQTNPHNPEEKRIIICISRGLSEAEKKYAQIELEALAPVWAMERLYMYLLANYFDLYCDNKAIYFIFNNPLAKPPARIQRWELRIYPYNFKVIHTPGLGNIADFLSRHHRDK